MIGRQHSLRSLLFSAAFCALSFLPLAIAIPAQASAAPLPKTFAAACTQVTDQSKETADAGQGENCIFSTYINPFVKLLAGIAGLAVLISVVMGAIGYQTSAGDPGKVAKAKGHIYQAFTALLAFLFLMAFLAWLLPGGISGKGS
ncbi:MAG TPA: hypothetical protein VIM53_04430 [Candidatus Saccharimonadales bacterium]